MVEPQTDRAEVRTRDRVWALLVIVLIVVAITAGIVFLIGAGCGCTTVPAR